MDWRCPDCGRREGVRFPEVITEGSGGEKGVRFPEVITEGSGGEKGNGVYLLCLGCGVLLFAQLRRREATSGTDVWGIPRGA